MKTIIKTVSTGQNEAEAAEVDIEKVEATKKEAYRSNAIELDEEEQTYALAGEILRSGGLVAFPTETVYGLGGDALRVEASKKIYAAKGRPSDNPLIVHIGDISQMEQVAGDIPKEAYLLAEKFWPGPLTMVLSKSEIVPYETTGGLDTVAVRYPNHPVALKLLRSSGVMIAAPSANTSGRPSPTCARHVAEDLEGKIEMILDGGSVSIGLESTIVDLTGEVPTILRPGYITKEMLEQVVGPVETDRAILEENASLGLRPKAPGMRYRHYAPKGELTIFEGERAVVTRRINEEAKLALEAGKSVGIIATEETKLDYPYGRVRVIGSLKDEETIARGLYEVLRDFDTDEAEVILGESYPEEGIGQAIMNRLMKAAGHHLVHVE